MLKLLSKLLNRHSNATVETNKEEDIPELEQRKELYPWLEKKPQLQEFLQFITSHLPPAESARLSNMAAESLENAGSCFDAINESILSEHGQKLGQWIFIQTDWKAEDELEWQANELLLARNIKEQWQHDWKNNPIGVPKALIRFSDWLNNYELSLLHINTESDCYCSFIVEKHEAELAIALASEAELMIECRETFLENNT